MRRLVESTLVTLGGEIATPHEWGMQYWNPEHAEYADRLLFAADALLLGRMTYEGLSSAYPTMDRETPGVPVAFIDRMNSIPKYVASTTLREVSWNATLLIGDVAARVAELKQQPGQNILKYGTGPLDRTLMEHGLIDEFHFWIFPVALGSGQRLFEHIDVPTHLRLTGTTTFSSGVVVLTYAPL
jgi:dihydrofolate reductase